MRNLQGFICSRTRRENAIPNLMGVTERCWMNKLCHCRIAAVRRLAKIKKIHNFNYSFPLLFHRGVRLGLHCSTVARVYKP
ncbi:hypothetical protein EUGRSUZ_B03787 [Eucalyptus grandis]|uniref:Uncharacterized protein n=2 Tax=Eucalyptus grandis TaxID=71139 RepID=A0ACC3LY98_EUCGR|nr:hypothetical protein EUGRSUZ_B03787 [Eucalyptus grandis]